MTFEAKFHQPCASCGEDVKGEPVRYVGNDLVHDDCDGVAAASTQLDRDAGLEVCADCWLVNCDCEVT